MSLLANVVGFSLVGLAARFGQLGIQKQNLFMSSYLFCILSVDFRAKLLLLSSYPGYRPRRPSTINGRIWIRRILGV